MGPPGSPSLEIPKCWLTVYVYNTDFDDAEEYVISTTANGEEVHGKCSPSDGADVGPRGFFTCAKDVLLPYSPNSTYAFMTNATDAVDENAYRGS